MGAVAPMSTGRSPAVVEAGAAQSGSTMSCLQQSPLTHPGRVHREHAVVEPWDHPGAVYEKFVRNRAEQQQNSKKCVEMLVGMTQLASCNDLKMSS